MAIATMELIVALRDTASRLSEGADYRWTHLGACNCGHLAQVLTPYSREQIHRFALQRPGDWAEQATEFCVESGLPIDHIFATMMAVGLSTEDIANLERLADRRVLQRLPSDVFQRIDYRNREHVVHYLLAWADLLESELPTNPARPLLGRIVAPGAKPPADDKAALAAAGLPVLRGRDFVSTESLEKGYFPR